MQRYIKDILAQAPGDEIFDVEGWIRTSRDTKNVIFVELSDGSCLKGLQLILDKENPGLAGLADKLHTGASLTARGKLAASPGGKQAVEFLAESVTVFGEAPPESYPLQKKRHSFEYLREIAHLRPRTNTLGAVTRIQNRISFNIHRFFQERGFVYVHTPLISGSDAEGAGQMFQVTTLNIADPPRTDQGKVDYSQDFFGKETRLTVSGQLEGEAYALAMKNIYTFGPTFRAENSNTSRHLAEFWMIEPEMAFCELAGNMAVAEEFLKFVIGDVLENCREDMEFFDQWIEKGIIENLRKVCESRFIHLPYTQAVEELAKAKKEFEFPVSWGTDLQSEHEKYLTEEVFKSPVIVTDYPREIKSFYMKQNDDGKTVRAMDVLVPRLGEIIGGSQREDSHDKLLTRLKELGLDPADYWWYLELRRYGSAPHSGFGLGFERLVQYVTGMTNIRDVIPFPRTVKSAF